MLISVVIPVYNGAAYLRTCLDSVLRQDVPEMEVIAVDDGSTDETWAVLQEIAAGDPRVKPIHQANAGVSAARNTALCACTGTYIRFVDADDALPAGSMKVLLEAAREDDSQLVIAGYTEVFGSARTERNLRPIRETLSAQAMLRHLDRWSNSFYYGVLWNKLFRRDVIEAHQVRFIPGLNWGEDFAFVCRYLSHVQRVSRLDEFVYDYRRNPGGMTMKQFLDCVRHPLENCKMKWLIYQELKSLYQHQGIYKKHRATLWLYLFRTTLSN